MNLLLLLLLHFFLSFFLSFFLLLVHQLGAIVILNTKKIVIISIFNFFFQFLSLSLPLLPLLCSMLPDKKRRLSGDDEVPEVPLLLKKQATSETASLNSPIVPQTNHQSQQQQQQQQPEPRVRLVGWDHIDFTTLPPIDERQVRRELLASTFG